MKNKIILGLIDEGETTKDAALRELKEECGYEGTGIYLFSVFVFSFFLTLLHQKHFMIKSVHNNSLSPPLSFPSIFALR